MEKVRRVLSGGLLSAALMGVATHASAVAANDVCTYTDPKDPAESYPYFCGAGPIDGPRSQATEWHG
ncbi:hypothetical protein QFZ99_007473 [Paraburkholderia atlantica]|uniref:Uncharacterized protein n=1 Tax=Paraburkholderia youngii TaxID=2782701 RepID=A0A7W8LFF8_9BURK|nr:hypothetical protein [Paraburkholderia youngii]